MTGDPLRPVRDALLDGARERADGLRGEAGAAAAATIAAARRRAESILAEARATGRAEGEAAARRARAGARREAGAIVLAAHRAAFDELRRQVREAVRGLRADPCYPALLDRLTRIARTAAGPGAAVVEHPSGGVEAWSAGIRVDLSADALADRAIAGLSGKAATLWES
jgi:vacuolar-type H+-ATPase subunit E/Vma4